MLRDATIRHATQRTCSMDGDQMTVLDPYLSRFSLDSSRFLILTRSITHSWFLNTSAPSIPPPSPGRLDDTPPLPPSLLPLGTPPPRRCCCCALCGDRSATTSQPSFVGCPEASRRSSAAGAIEGGDVEDSIPGFSSAGGVNVVDGDVGGNGNGGGGGGGEFCVAFCAPAAVGDATTRERSAFLRARFSFDIAIRSNSSWCRMTSLPTEKQHAKCNGTTQAHKKQKKCVCLFFQQRKTHTKLSCMKRNANSNQTPTMPATGSDGGGEGGRSGGGVNEGSYLFTLQPFIKNQPPKLRNWSCAKSKKKKR